MKLIEALALIVFSIVMAWFLFSWADVLLHNNPTDGDRNYNPANMFVVIGALYE